MIRYHIIYLINNITYYLSPMGVAEHGVSLMCALNRKIHLAHKRMLAGNFTHKGLMG